jgi:chaperonin cofactor prefoldin
MNRRHISDHVQAKLATFERAVEDLTERIARTQDAIDSARQRLTGGFQKDQEYHDLRSTLAQVVADKPVLEKKLSRASWTLRSCKNWLDGLPDDVVLEPVTAVKPNGHALSDVKERLKDAEAELEKLASVPVPSADIAARVREYIASLGRPAVSGVSDGQRLEVSWPSSSAVSLLGVLLPDKMVEVLMAEVERATNVPLPLAERQAHGRVEARDR